ncbi:MAG: radical SAM protein [Candidatus Altiarchaeota archaeon]|nr:radical SAM protein [Candidatus Altiarchaeota archaeon]
MKALLLQPHDGRIDTSALLDTTIFSYSLLYLASPLIEEGHEVAVDLATVENVKSLVSRHSPDVVGVTFTTPKYPAARAVIREIREHAPDVKVVVGGHHATFLSEETLRETGADYVVRGEGEIALPALLRSLSSGIQYPKLDGVSYIKDGVFVDSPITRVKDLDSLPTPAWELIPKKYRARKQRILASRGCPFKCDFCSVSAFHGGSWRTRSVGNILDEVEVILDNGYSMIEFIDDNFTLDYTRVAGFCKGVEERGLDFRWGVQARVDDIHRNPDLIPLLSEHGCYRVSVGVESGVQDVLDSYGKEITVEQAKNVISLMKDSSMLGYWYFILGSGGAYDTPEVIEKSINFMGECDFDVAQVSMLTPFPGTRLYDRLKNEGRLLTGDWSLYDGSHCVYTPSGMTAAQMEKYFMEAYRNLYVNKGVMELARKMRKAFKTGFMEHKALMNVAGLLARAYILGEDWTAIYGRKSY